MKFKVNKKDEWIMAFCMLIFLNPYYCWHNQIFLLSSIIITLIFVIRNPYIVHSKKIFVYGIVLFYVLAALRHFSLLGGVFLLLMPTLLFLDRDFLLKSYKKFIYIYAATLIPSLLVYFAITFFSLPITGKVIESYNSLKDYSYIGYPFLVVDDVFTGWSISRFCGMYDEPGVVGSLAAVILCIEKFDYKKWYNIPVFIAGLFSFSLYFYIICILYIFIYAKTVYKVVIIAVAFLILPVLMTNSDLNILIFDRFVIENGSLAGNSRTSASFDAWYQKFQQSSDYLWGLGAENGVKIKGSTASYKEIIVSYGLLMFLIYILSWLFYSFEKSNGKKAFIPVFLIGSFIFQRPFITDYSIMITFLYCVYSSQLKPNKL